MEMTNQTNPSSKQQSTAMQQNKTSQQQNLKMHTLAPLFVIFAAIFWGVLVVFVRAFGQANFSSMEIVTLRVYSSAIFIWIFLAIQSLIQNHLQTRMQNQPLDCTQACMQNQPQDSIKNFVPAQTKDRNHSGKNTSLNIFRFQIKDTWCFIGTGLVSIVFFSYCYFRNVEVSSAAVAAILMYTSPVFVTLLSAVFFKEKITKTKLLALLLAIIGCALVSGIAGGISNVSPLGIALGLGSGIGYALYSVFARFALEKGYAPLFVTAMTFTFACVGVLPFIDIVDLCTRLIGEPEYLLLALAMGLIGSCIPFALYTIGLKHMEASKAAILATLEPIVTALVGTFLYKEPIDLFIIMGIVMVLVAGVLCAKTPKSSKQSKKLQQNMHIEINKTIGDASR